MSKENLIFKRIINMTPRLLIFFNSLIIRIIKPKRPIIDASKINLIQALWVEEITKPKDPSCKISAELPRPIPKGNILINSFIILYTLVLPLKSNTLRPPSLTSAKFESMMKFCTMYKKIKGEHNVIRKNNDL